MAVVTKVELYGPKAAGDVRGFDCASGTLIPKGTVLKLTNNRTAIASDGLADPFAGVASADKSATDGTTRVGAWQNGVLEFTTSETITVGDKVVTQGNTNVIITATAAHAASTTHVVIGYALKTATEGNRVQVRVDN